MVAPLVTGSRTIDRAESRKRAVTLVRNISDIRALLNEIEALHAEYELLRPQVARELAVMEQLRDLLFRNFANNNEAVRTLIADRDRIRASRLYQIDKVRKDMVAREIGVGLRARESGANKAIADLESRAKRIFGVSVKADQFEVLVLKGRKVTSGELALLGRISADSETVEALLKDLLKKNAALLDRAVAARQKFERWAAVNFNTFGKLGPIEQLAARIQGAAETFRSYDRMLKTQTLEIEAGINAMRQIRTAVGDITENSTGGDLADTLRNIRSIAVVAGAGLTAGGAPVIGGLAIGVAALAQMGALLLDAFKDTNADEE